MIEEARSVDKVLEKIISFIPEKEIKIKTILIEYRDSLCNKAPELRRSSVCWVPLQEILSTNINIFDEDWKCKVLNEFNNV
jgi:hypothetical protein